MKASDLFVRALEHEGVEFLFGIPGEENLDLLESLRGSCLLYTSPSPRDGLLSRMPSSA